MIHDSLSEEQIIINRLLHSSDNSQKQLYDYRVRPRGFLMENINKTIDYMENDDPEDNPVHIIVDMYLRFNKFLCLLERRGGGQVE